MDTPEKPRVVQPGDKYLVRLPEGMRTRIAETAKANKRSMNAEIVARLEASFGGGEDLVDKLTRVLDARDTRMLDELKTNVQQLLRKGDGSAKD